MRNLWVRNVRVELSPSEANTAGREGGGGGGEQPTRHLVATACGTLGIVVVVASGYEILVFVVVWRGTEELTA